MKLVTTSKSQLAERLMKRLVSEKAIAPEKKPFASDLGASFGPYLATQGEGAMMDAASQIASLGLGFSPCPAFGAAHHLESWLNHLDTEPTLALKKAYQSFLLRKLGWCVGRAFFCNSGAEANETALGQCFARRTNKNARRVLAFKGSFHGRMLVSLLATWNPVKREPFEVKGFETRYAEYPEMKSDTIEAPPIPSGWRALWEEAGSRSFLSAVGRFQGRTPLQDREIGSLLQVRKILRDGEVFAVIIEPMQCEGGDRYSSARFHNALINMTRAYGVPLVYDEIQTGFGLGGTFFWHRMFDLRDGSGRAVYPDYVVCAKKAQVGVVLSREKIPWTEQFSVGSLARGSIQGLMIDQNGDKIRKIEQTCRRKCVALVKRHKNLITAPRVRGLAFAFDFKDANRLAEFIRRRFEHGLLYYPAGSRTARFRMNLSYEKGDIELLFSRLDDLLTGLGSGKAVVRANGKNGSPEIPEPGRFESAAKKLSTHKAWLELKLAEAQGRPMARAKVNALAREVLLSSFGGVQRKSDFRMVEITSRNWKDYRHKVSRIEKLVYEPTRQTDIESFDALIRDGTGFGLGVLLKGRLVAIAFGGPLSLFPYERGARNDCGFLDPHCFYMLDVTVCPACQGGGLGRALKYAFSMIASARGVEVIAGRNRDKLARGMLGINLSMGAYEYQYLPNDYPDCEKYCDSFYYKTPVQWIEPEIHLSRGIDSPLQARGLTRSFLHEHLPALLNKVSLANFVSPGYLRNMGGFLELVPEKMRHVYSASSQAECVDKLFKVLWLKNKPKSLLVTFEECFFGAGSFLSRALSGLGETFFDVERLPFPSGESEKLILGRLARLLESATVHSVWIEPMGQRTGRRISREFLVALRRLCRSHQIPLVYNETASAFGRYEAATFFAGNEPTIEPDAAFAFLGGQMGLAFMKQELFDPTPLLLISTWDGDEFSFARFMRSVAWWKGNRARCRKERRTFARNLKRVVSRYVTEYQVRDGAGYLRGHLPPALARMFRPTADGSGWLVLPSMHEMVEFNRRCRLRGQGRIV